MDAVLKGEVGAFFLFLYLLPGFLGAVVYDYLVEREAPSNFDRIIEALVLTLTGSIVVHLIFGRSLLPDIQVLKDTSLIMILDKFLNITSLYISLVSISISIVLAFANNHRYIYYILNKCRFTYKNGNGDVWQDTFYSNKGFWVRIVFQDGSSLVGWPKYYSSIGKPRELFMAEAAWWKPDRRGRLTSIDVVGEGVYISDFTKVIAIEILEGQSMSAGMKEKNDGTK